MACKSLIVGFKPHDSFDELFPFENAMVEIAEDGSDFSSKINWWLDHPQEYKQAVDRNYEYCRKYHSPACRVESMLAVLKNR